MILNDLVKVEKCDSKINNTHKKDFNFQVMYLAPGKFDCLRVIYHATSLIAYSQRNFSHFK